MFVSLPQFLPGHSIVQYSYKQYFVFLSSGPLHFCEGLFIFVSWGTISPVDGWAHNPSDVGSNPSPATIILKTERSRTETSKYGPEKQKITPAQR
jgi:hypothetical protein